ncbi:MAG: hypothetical protein WDN00_07885 [Limisphaerales bacterium]
MSKDPLRRFWQGKIGGQDMHLNLCDWRNSLARVSNASVLRATRIKRLPSAAKHFASSKPMPEDAPVIKTVSLFMPFMA